MRSETPKRILVLVGFTRISSTVLNVAIEMARALRGELVLVHVGTRDAEADTDEWREGISRTEIAAALRRQQLALQKMQDHARKKGVTTTSLLVRARAIGGSSIRKIIQEMTRLNPDLIVLGTHGHGPLHELFHGSLGGAVVRNATCPILLVPNRRRLPARQT